MRAYHLHTESDSKISCTNSEPELSPAQGWYRLTKIFILCHAYQIVAVPVVYLCCLPFEADIEAQMVIYFFKKFLACLPGGCTDCLFELSPFQGWSGTMKRAT